MKQLSELNFSELVDEASGLVLKQLIRGELRSGVSDALHLATKWAQEPQRQTSADAVAPDQRVVPVGLLTSAIKTIQGLAPGRFAIEQELREAITPFEPPIATAAPICIYPSNIVAQRLLRVLATSDFIARAGNFAGPDLCLAVVIEDAEEAFRLGSVGSEFGKVESYCHGPDHYIVFRDAHVRGDLSVLPPLSRRELLDKLRSMHPDIKWGEYPLGDYAQNAADGAPETLVCFGSEEHGILEGLPDPYSTMFSEPCEPSEWGISEEAAQLIVAHNKVFMASGYMLLYVLR